MRYEFLKQHQKEYKIEKACKVLKIARSGYYAHLHRRKSKNKVWVGDITYIPTRHGALYLAVFVDIFSKKVTGWALDIRIKDVLAMSALCQAVGREHPEAGLIVHTDLGAQYTSHRFTALLQRYQFKQSMSRKGNPYDNAIMEPFYRTLKRELVQGANYDTPEQARLDIFEYIETHFNTSRMHSALDYLSPVDFKLLNSKKS